MESLERIDVVAGRGNCHFFSRRVSAFAVKTLAASILATAVLTSCHTPSPAPPRTCDKGAITFEPPEFSLGTRYTGTRALLNTGTGLRVAIVDFVEPSGQKDFGNGQIRVSPNSPLGAGPIAFGANQVLHLNNVAIEIDVLTGTQIAEFEYLNFGGTINFGVSNLNTNLHIGYLPNLPTLINGASIKKSGVVA